MSWTDLASSQDGVISRAQLRAAGISDTSIARMRAKDQLRPITSAVYLVSGAPLTYRARLWSAVVVTESVLGFETAAQLWGMTDRTSGLVHVVLPHDRRVYPPGWVRVHRVPVAASSVERLSGLPVTSRSWTLCDYLPTLRPFDRVQLADRSVQRGWIRPADIERRLRAYPGRTGNRALRRLLAQMSDGAAAKSERVLHGILRNGGVTGWVPNYPVWHAGELVGVVDVALPEQRLALEVDGWAYHHDPERFQRDRARQNALVMLGWTVLRFTWADLTERPAAVLAAIREASVHLPDRKLPDRR